MAIAKVIFNGQTQMDVTQDTVTAARMLSPYTATRADGVRITGNIATKTASDMTVSGATVTAQKGYYASNTSKTVASGTAGNPVATKGTVTNHSVTVTPSVTNTSGYITGSTKIGTAVTVSASELVSGTKNITDSDNGNTIDVTNYEFANVNIVGQVINNQNKTVTPSRSQQIITADSGYTGLGTVTVEAETMGHVYAPIISKSVMSGLNSATITAGVVVEAGYVTGQTLQGNPITVSASELVSGSQTIMENGTVDVTNLAEVVVNVPTSDVINNQAKTVDAPKFTPIQIGQSNDLVVTPDAGYTGLSSVTVHPTPLSVLEITASASAVQNNSVTITPNVVVETGNDGYVPAGTYSGSENAITIDASDLVSGTLPITTNGTVDVTNYANVAVSVVSGDGTINNQNKTITPSTVEQVVMADPGYTGLGIVTVEAVQSGSVSTPRIVRSPVSNHSIDLLPTVSTQAGLIETNSSLSGETITITASELVSGSQTVTSNGYVRVTNLDEVIVQVPGGGGLAQEQLVNFIDYDGTLLYSYSYDEFADLSILPRNPSYHDNLIPQGWNWTLQEIQTQLAAVPDGKIWVGQSYTTASGGTEIDVSFNDPDSLSPYLAINVDGNITVDWGDGTTKDSLSGTSLDSLLYIGHTYSQIGDYTITIATIGSTGIAFGGTNNNYAGILSPVSASNARRFANTYSNKIQAIRIGPHVKLNSRPFNALRNCKYFTVPTDIEWTNAYVYVFRNCGELTSLVIPPGVTGIGRYCFQNDASLDCVSIPPSMTYLGANTFESCTTLKNICLHNNITTIASAGNTFINAYGLRNLVLPINANITEIPEYMFNNCYSLERLILPNSITTIGDEALSGCSGIKSLTIPASVTSIGASCFAKNYGVEEYHFKSTTPPTLADANTFTSIVAGTIIYVPRGCGNAYKTATNWSTYASYIQEESA